MKDMKIEERLAAIQILSVALEAMKGVGTTADLDNIKDKILTLSDGIC